jgi:hypothetical protein
MLSLELLQDQKEVVVQFDGCCTTAELLVDVVAISCQQERLLSALLVRQLACTKCSAHSKCWVYHCVGDCSLRLHYGWPSNMPSTGRAS